MFYSPMGYLVNTNFECPANISIYDLYTLISRGRCIREVIQDRHGILVLLFLMYLSNNFGPYIIVISG